LKVVIDSNLMIGNLFEPPVELVFRGDIITIKDVLERLGNICESVQFLRKDGDLGNDVDEVFINDENYITLKRDINTYLKEGDKVTVNIYYEILGGG